MDISVVIGVIIGASGGGGLVGAIIAFAKHCSERQKMQSDVMAVNAEASVSNSEFALKLRDEAIEENRAMRDDLNKARAAMKIAQEALASAERREKHLIEHIYYLERICDTGNLKYTKWEEKQDEEK